MNKMNSMSFVVSDNNSDSDVSMRVDGSFDMITYVTPDEMDLVLDTAAKIHKSRLARHAAHN